MGLVFWARDLDFGVWNIYFGVYVWDLDLNLRF